MILHRSVVIFREIKALVFFAHYVFFPILYCHRSCNKATYVAASFGAKMVHQPHLSMV
jgi:hypothetical protein